jgi:hypothetical protein
MVATFIKIKSRPANWREWEMNPIVIKELRQAVRSRVLSGVLMILLLLLFFGSVLSLAQQDLTQNVVLEMGRSMFDVCVTVLVIGGVIFIPIYTGIRVALEKYYTDMVLYTPLPVTKLVNGKLLSGMYIAMLFFSVCAPFMAFSNLLRGLDWLTIQFVVFYLFFAIYIAILSAIAVAVQPFRMVAKLVCGAVFVGALVLACWILLAFFFNIVSIGVGPLLRTATFWLGLAMASALGAVVAMAAYSVSTSHIVSNSLGNDSFGEIKFQPSTR